MNGKPIRRELRTKEQKLRISDCGLRIGKHESAIRNPKSEIPPMVTKIEIAADWLTRYTGMPLDLFGNFVLLTNFRDYVQRFAARFACDIYGDNRPMQASTNDVGLTIINFGIGSPNAATIMDLLTAYHPQAVLFLGKCGGLKHATEIGHFILPIGAIRGEGTSDDYLPPLVPALPSFKLHKFRSEERRVGKECRSGWWADA